MARLIIKLTKHQLKQLAPAFAAHEASEDGSCIIAQVFRDGIVVKVLTLDQSRKLADIVAKTPEDAERIKASSTDSVYGW